LSAFEKVSLISAFLWFDKNAQDAGNFYLSVFDRSNRLEVLHNTCNGPVPASLLTITFELDGQEFTAIKDGPMFKFSEAIRLQFAATRKKWWIITGRSCRWRK